LPTVSLNDRPADRQSHAQAAGFSGEESREQTVHVLGRDPASSILHGYEHMVSDCLRQRHGGHKRVYDFAALARTVPSPQLMARHPVREYDRRRKDLPFV
jgi:hypothetical protein